jgi:hypothetical protein
LILMVCAKTGAARKMAQRIASARRTFMMGAPWML